MAVTSTPLKSSAPRRKSGDLALKLLEWSVTALILLLVVPLVWVWNGAYSIKGIAWIAGHNAYAFQVWTWLATWTFPVPMPVPGVDPIQPVIPWLFVVCFTLIEVCALACKLVGKDIPLRPLVVATTVCVIDFLTTLAGLGTEAWLVTVGLLGAAPLALVLAFFNEWVLAYAIRRKL